MELMPIDGKIVIEFGGYRHKGWITAATFNAEKGFGEYTVKINLRKSIQEDKQTMTNTHNWQECMKVILKVQDADNSYHYQPGYEEEGVIEAVANNTIFARMIKSSMVLQFDMNGIHITHPGMSIRPAKEKAKTITQPPGEIRVQNENITAASQFNAEFISSEKPTTPSQWIEGQIPSQESPKLFWMRDDKGRIGRVFVHLDHISSLDKSIYGFCNHTHYIPIEDAPELPPPPPVKEVEAYGYLDFCNKYVKDWQDYSQGGVDKADKARAFFSQPATAEVLERYLDIKGREKQPWRHNREESIDQFISQLKSEQPKTKLIFKPAALKELGVK